MPAQVAQLLLDESVDGSVQPAQRTRAAMLGVQRPSLNKILKDFERQMRRGDVIFHGPNGSQHDAIYLGDGQMREAPYTGATARIAPVRTAGMTPFVTRFIEY